MRYEDNLPDPELVNPERYMAAVSAFEGRDVSLGKEDVKFLTGEDLGDELEDLVEFRILSRNSRGGKTVYRPRDDYAQRLSKECEKKITLVYDNAREFLEDDGAEEMINALEYDSITF